MAESSFRVSPNTNRCRTCNRQPEDVALCRSERSHLNPVALAERTSPRNPLTARCLIFIRNNLFLHFSPSLVFPGRSVHPLLPF